MLYGMFETTIEEKINAIKFLESKGYNVISSKYSDFDYRGMSRAVLRIRFEGSKSELESLEVEFDSLFPAPNTTMRSITIEDCNGDIERLNHHFGIKRPKKMTSKKFVVTEDTYIPADHLKEIIKAANNK